MFDPGFDAYVGVSTTELFEAADGTDKIGYLLWGDGVRRLEGDAHGRAHVQARGRGRRGWVAADALNGRSLLELYFIDVGQGDGVLVKTPDFRHLVIDGGHPRGSQNTGKSGADFVDWKFYEDYGAETIKLDAMIASHNDFDHYGGLNDLLDAAQIDELDASGVAVEAFYHSGVSWWTRSDGTGRTLGETQRVDGKTYFVQLLGDRGAAETATDGATTPQLQGAWGKFIANVVAARNAAGEPTKIARLSNQLGYLPGFEDGDMRIRVLGPIESEIADLPALEALGSDSKSTNGNSILLRMDYGNARFLLTGDLNKDSQHSILEALNGDLDRLACDVVKACHHGSEDVSFSFLQAMAPAATVISSGDADGHDHPRPRIVAASALTGYKHVENDQLVTPLVYSTELARSVAMGRPTGIEVSANVTGGAPLRIGSGNLQNVVVDFNEVRPGELQPKKRKGRLSTTRVVGSLIYGLVNVRTDGRTILTATMNEGDGSWTVKTFKARFG